jgi:hypothetical protein
MARRLGGAERVHLNHMALGDQVGSALLHRTTHRESSSLLPLNPESAVRVETVDHYCAERQIEAIDFLKLEVQGFEPECVRGGCQMLEASRIGVIQAELVYHRIYERAARFSDLEGSLNPRGYRLYTILDVSVGDTNGELLALDAVFVRA